MENSFALLTGVTTVILSYRKPFHNPSIHNTPWCWFFFSSFLAYLQFKCFGDQNHDTEFPHLLHSVNVTQVDIEFVKIAVANVQKPRIAIEFVYVADEADHELGHKHGQRTFTISTRKTLDDEHTPGIFELIDIISPESLIASRG